MLRLLALAVSDKLYTAALADEPLGKSEKAVLAKECIWPYAVLSGVV